MATEKNLTNLPAAPSGARNGTFQVDPTPSGTDATTGQPYFNVSIYMPDMIGDTGSGGQDGLVPAPAPGDAAAGKFLKADGTWTAVSGSVTASEIQQEAFTYAADTGSANAYAVTLSPAPTVVAGSQVVFKVANANTGTSTLAVNGGSATLITKDGSSILDAGDISDGQIVICIFDGTNWQAQGLAPALILTPNLRGTGIIADTGVSSKTITLPSGSQDGDLAILFANGYFAPTVPSGWTDLSIASQSTWQAIGASKILSSGDISTGSVSVSFGGSGNCVLAIAVFVGSTGGVREVESGDNAGAPITITNTTTSAVLNSDVAIYFATARNPSSTPTITPGSGSATTLQSETTNTHSVLADQLMPGGVVAVANLFSSAGSGATAAQIIVQGVSSGIGSVSSVGLAVPSRQTVSGSPITSSGTLTITDNTQNANLVFAGPSSGSSAAPTFRTLVSADVPGSLSNPMTTEGDIIYGGTAGAPTRLAAGTSGQVLQTNGSGAAPTWVTGGGGGGGGGGSLILLEEHTASNSTSLNFTSRNATGQSGATFQTDFDDYLIEFVALLPASGGVAALLQVSTNGGSTYDAGSNYKWSGFRNSSSGTATAGGSGKTSFGLDCSGNVGNSSNMQGLSGSIRFFNPCGSSAYPPLLGSTMMFDGSDYVTNQISGGYQSTTAVNAFTFFFSSGNIVSGSIRVYGISK